MAYRLSASIAATDKRPASTHRRDVARRRIWLWLAVALGGCASDPPPRAPYVPPPVVSARAEGYANDHQHRLGGVDPDVAEGAAASVRGLTYEEFLVCTRQKAALKSQQGKLRADSRDLEVQQIALADDEKALSASRAKVDVSKEVAVDAYNARVQQQYGRVREFNARLKAFNVAVDQTNGDAGGYTLNCANRPFRATDIDRLPDELRAIAREDISTFDLPTYFDDDSSGRNGRRRGVALDTAPDP